ncbi:MULTISPECIES: erythromycin esterase family protein [unclassified Leptolyngbya]|uniref:erythromycin esterase family protein n=1 Tax=unclassified Leptolyngbya TaxID=2650499 RepID=UPI0016884E9F|nr:MULTISPECIES: erythromycin esterase family protein [unclassified Leptolyngbya]MBD1913989.1 erythromycin esterase family protein [Leptolyngbya sp. FACHB-8]MBD2154399.1 erythromycin esterase family protein [Leptolyngbya sp. FACHB-16]
MPDTTVKTIAHAVRQVAHPLTDAASDYDPLMDLIGDARFVLLGEATHGTHDFYEQRAEITKRLIQEKGFTAVAVEADFPDGYRVNRFVRGVSRDQSAEEALRGFQRFPAWMWRNTDVINFVSWLRQYNDALSSNHQKVGFYGVDLYSMYASIGEVLKYLEQVDPEAAQRARDRYSCFEHFEEDSQEYGYIASFDVDASCQDETVNQLLELQQQTAKYLQQDGGVAIDEFFYAEQNARLVKNAEEYYRSMFQGRVDSWNVRDRHMAETLEQLMNHLEQQGTQSKLVVWEHNSHLGDARATDMGQGGEWNVGQLMRERYGQAVFLVGFTTYTGTVTAASNWDEPPQLKNVRPALPDSYEDLFHNTELPRFLLDLRADNQAVAELRQKRMERAIGVIYRPETERLSHYFYACLPDQFDAVIHIDDTRAVEPLDRTVHQNTSELPETFPSTL